MEKGLSTCSSREGETEESLSVVGRRIESLVRQFAATSMEGQSDRDGDLSFQPTAGSAVFAFQHLEQAPEDPILWVTVAYNKNSSLVKLNLGVGAYRTEEGKPLSLNVVRQAEELLIQDKSLYKEYLPITGLADFNKLSAKLILCDGELIL